MGFNNIKAERKQIYTAMYEFVIRDSNAVTHDNAINGRDEEVEELKSQLSSATEILQKISINLGRRHSSTRIEEWKKEKVRLG